MSNKLSAEGTKRLLEVSAQLTPDNLDIDVWCGSTQCIAGHLAMNAGYVRAPGFQSRVLLTKDGDPSITRTVSDVVAELLGIDLVIAKYGLFHHNGWPSNFTRAYDDAVEDSDGPGRVAATRGAIQDFIERYS